MTARSTTPSTATLAVGLAAVSLITLLYELVQIRVFAFSLDPLVAYCAIAMAMLGFGAGATWMALRTGRAGETPSDAGLQARLAWLSLGLSVSIVLANRLFAFLSPAILPSRTYRVDVLATAVTLLPCVVPYGFAGLLIALMLHAGVRHAGKLYFWNLLGSGVGCVLAVVLLRPLGAERLVMLCALGAAGLGLAFSVRRPGSLRLVAAGTLAACLVLTLYARELLVFQPDRNELVYFHSATTGDAVHTELTEWDPVGRIDILRHDNPAIFVEEPTEFRTITNDSGAITLMIRPPAGTGKWGRALLAESLYGVAYRLKKEPRVLVVGVGGGLDVLAALHANAKQVVGVEVSLSTVRALTGPYASFAGWPTDPRVHLVHADGRSYAKQTSERFDVVQLSGVDTFTMHSASAMVTAEDYLYTVDAFVDFLSLLEADGVLAVTRFRDEALSLAVIAAAALRRLGVSEPAHHIGAVEQAFGSGIVVKRTPLTDADRLALQSVEDRQTPNQVRIAHYDDAGLRASTPMTLLYPPGRKRDQHAVSLFDAMSDGGEIQALRNMRKAFILPTDDRPYYMLGVWVAAPEQVVPIIRALETATGVIAGSALLLILLPLVSLRRSSGAGPATFALVLASFFALGASFMLLEVGLIHRTIVFVGNPGASVSVVIGSILTFSGVGSLVSDLVPWSIRRRLLVAFGGLVVVGLCYRWGAPAIYDLLFALPDWGRGAAAALGLAPVGFFAGWFFPLGLKLVGNRPSLIPWAIAVNAFASVLGSLATLLLSLLLGFSTVFILALGGYVIAVAAFLALDWRAKAGSLTATVGGMSSKAR